MTDSKREIKFSMKAFLAFFLTFMLSLSFLAYQINTLENTNLILSERLTQLEEKQTELQSFLEKNYGVSSLEELEQKLKMRYTGNPFTTELWSGQLQAENITGMHWYTYLSGVLQNRTDVLAYPEQTATFIIRNDTSTNDVYAKNTTSGQIQYGGAWDAGGVDGSNASAVIQAASNALPATGGKIVLKGTFTITSVIDWKTGVWYVGEGEDSTILDATGQSCGIFRVADPTSRTKYGGIANLRLKGDSDQVAINATGLVESTLINLLIENFEYAIFLDGNYGGTSTPAIRNHIENVKIWNCKYGIKLTGVKGSGQANQNNFYNVMITTNVANSIGIDIDIGSSNKFYGGEVAGATTGIRINFYDNWIFGILLENNDNALNLTSSSDTTSNHIDAFFTGNTVDINDDAGANAKNTIIKNGEPYHSQITFAMLTFTSYTSVSADSTVYIGLSGQATVEANAEYVVPFDCVARNMYVIAGSAPGTGESFTYTLRVNGASTDLSVVVSDSSRTNSDNADYITLSAGDRVCIQLVTSASASSTVHSVTIELIK
ncbi:hypothetical protein DRJ17_06990 [Candidatus Woesearchaeota archaeon]|nr:MAG: hypothetical protein DRJ17_06990 [Candidatus Woesearchaeota archaeon]